MSTDPIITVLSADPPWRFNDKLPGNGRGADKHYETLSVSEIQRFPLPALAHDALLALWRVGSMPEEALAVVRAWGFVPKSEVVWVKTEPKTPERLHEELQPEEEPWLHMGMGHYVRNAHEVAIIAARGRFAVQDKAVRSVIFAPVTEHSRKPAVFYQLLERLGGPEGVYGEIFGRAARPGWHVWGNEIDSGPEHPAGRYVWTPRAPPAAPRGQCGGPYGGHRYGGDGAQCLPDGTRLCVDCRAPEPEGGIKLTPELISASGVAVVRDPWALAAKRAELEAEDPSEEEDLAEVVRLPRHRIRRADGKIVPACCAVCRLPQYSSPSGVVCSHPQSHGGAASIPGCESCGEADGHRPGCAAAGIPAMTEPPPALRSEMIAAARPPELPVGPSADFAVAPPAAPAAPAPAPNPVLVAADAHNAANGHPTNQSGVAIASPPAPFVSDVKRDELLQRAKTEGLLNDADLAEGAHAAWIKLLYRAPRKWFPPPSWFQEGRTSERPLAPGEPPLIDLAKALGAKGLYATLVDISRWSPTQRDVARAWVAAGGASGELPEWLAPFTAPPAHAPQCADGCIGAEAGCPQARHAWGKVVEEAAAKPPPADPEPAKAAPAPAAAAATTPSVTPPAPETAAAAPQAKRGRGRPPGARNKPKDPWAAAAKAATQSDDPDVEEGFFS